MRWVYQAMVVDDDGQGLYSTGLRHGDAMYVTDMYPDRPGMEIFTIQENEDHAELFQTPGAAMRDARTGEILWSHSPAIDVTHGMAADIDPRHRGFEAWGGPGGLRDEQGKTIGRAPREQSWTIWWDGDPLRELVSMGRPSWQRPRRRRPEPQPTPNPVPNRTLSDSEHHVQPPENHSEAPAENPAESGDDQPSENRTERRPERGTPPGNRSALVDRPPTAAELERFRRWLAGRPTRILKWDWQAAEAKPLAELEGGAYSL